MALGKQAKTLTKQQIEFILGYLGNRRNGLRDQTIFLLSVRAGLRAKEIAHHVAGCRRQYWRSYPPHRYCI